jgi:hypothetical protein
MRKRAAGTKDSNRLPGGGTRSSILCANAD